jgi:hypothetical protein
MVYVCVMCYVGCFLCVVVLYGWRGVSRQIQSRAGIVRESDELVEGKFEDVPGFLRW